MTNTPNLGLHTWAGSDPVDVTEINENFQALDQNAGALSQAVTALTSAIGSGGHTCRMAFGSYVGDGTVHTVDNPKRLSVDFTPVLMICSSRDPNNLYRELPWILQRGRETYGRLEQVGNGGFVTFYDRKIEWYGDGYLVCMNISGRTYQWVVFGY